MKNRVIRMAFAALALALFLLAPSGCFRGVKLRFGGDEGPEDREKLEASIPGLTSKYDYEIALTYNVPVELFGPKAAKRPDQ